MKVVKQVPHIGGVRAAAERAEKSRDKKQVAVAQKATKAPKKRTLNFHKNMKVSEKTNKANLRSAQAKAKAHAAHLGRVRTMSSAVVKNNKVHNKVASKLSKEVK